MEKVKSVPTAPLQPDFLESLLRPLEYAYPDIRTAAKFGSKPNATLLAKSLKDFCDLNSFDPSDPSSQPLLSLSSKPFSDTAPKKMMTGKKTSVPAKHHSVLVTKKDSLLRH